MVGIKRWRGVCVGGVILGKGVLDGLGLAERLLPQLSLLS